MPNPDVYCNSEIKFKALINYAFDIGADYLATGVRHLRMTFTGHYAQVDHHLHDEHRSAELLMAADSFKDQTYFLSRVSCESLARSLFPIGHLQKVS